MAKQDVSLLEAALIGLEIQRDQTERAIAEIRARLGQNSAGYN